MPLDALTRRQDILAAYTTMATQLQHGAAPIQCNVGWQGGGNTFPVHWHAPLGFWALMEAFPNAHHPSGYWFGFGTDDPAHYDNQAPDAQLAMPADGTNRRFEGVFAIDAATNDIYVCHRGGFRVHITTPHSPSGLAPGPHKTTPHLFRPYYTAGVVSGVRWPNRLVADYFVLGPLNSPTLTTQIADFVRAVDGFKSAIR